MQASRKYPRNYMCDNGEVPRPATGKTPNRTLRVPEDIWRAAQEAAADQGRTLTEVIVTYLKRYVATSQRKPKDGTDA